MSQGSKYQILVRSRKPEALKAFVKMLSPRTDNIPLSFDNANGVFSIITEDNNQKGIYRFELSNVIYQLFNAGGSSDSSEFDTSTIIVNVKTRNLMAVLEGNTKNKQLTINYMCNSVNDPYDDSVNTDVLNITAHTDTGEISVNSNIELNKMADNVLYDDDIEGYSRPAIIEGKSVTTIAAELNSIAKGKVDTTLAVHYAPYYFSYKSSKGQVIPHGAILNRDGNHVSHNCNESDICDTIYVDKKQLAEVLRDTKSIFNRTHAKFSFKKEEKEGTQSTLNIVCIDAPVFNEGRIKIHLSNVTVAT